ncbi:MAG TPA: DUF2163 domain-containing protein [Pyrinomonadaceae bacterium]|jgi:uncharacterized phage protein (TIGR02218 family)
MSATQEIKDALASNVIFPCDLWKFTAADGTVAAYASHTRNLVYAGVTYKASPNEPSTSVITTGLEADTSEILIIPDDVMTKEDIEAGRWTNAVIHKEILVDYRTPSLGSVRKMKGWAGQFVPVGRKYRVEFRSLKDRLRQKVGDLTSNTDRNRTLGDTGVDVSLFTHETSVVSVTDRRKFKVSYLQPEADYFQYGLAEFTSGTNAGQKMEIKSSTDDGAETEIELQLKMHSEIAEDDEVTLTRGYKGTREDAKALGEEAVLNAQAEWDTPTRGFVLHYPE